MGIRLLPVIRVFRAEGSGSGSVLAGLARRGVYLFASGAVLSTLVFLAAIAGLGSVTQRFLPAVLRNLLNALVGCVLVFYAVRMLPRRARS